MEEWKRENPEGEEAPKRSGKMLLQLKRHREWLLALIVLLGVAALLWPVNEEKNAASPDSSLSLPDEQTALSGDIRRQLTDEIQQILSRMEGIGWVKVCLTLQSDGERTYAMNESEETRENTDTGQGGAGMKGEKSASARRDVAVAGGGPLVVENRMPQVAGVLVVAQGAGSAVMQQKITDAVAVLLNISPHRVRVLAGKEEQS